MSADPANLLNTEERDFGAGEFFCAEGIVARNDDPERRCRVQLTIPIIDENEIHEVWARLGNAYVGETGFGSYFVPAIGVECLVWGRFGDTNNLFYLPLFNETHKAPAEFSNDVQGIKVPKGLQFLAGEMMKLIAPEIQIIADTAKILAQNIESDAEGLNKITGEQIQIQGGTLTVNIDGSITIQGGNIQITGSSIKLFNRTVNPTGPPI